MKNSILSNRYAKALFAVAQEENAYDEYSKSLNEVAKAFNECPEMKDGLSNPIYPLDARAKVMEYVVETMGITGVIKNFLNLIVQKKRAEFLPEIAEAFQALVDQHNNVCQGSVVSATELSDELKGKVQATLEKLTGKKVQLTAEVDPSIIGGIIARVGDLVLDGSIKSQLAGLKESIKGSE